MVFTWVKLEQGGASPGPRSSHAACAIGHKLYVFGGEHEPRKPVDSALYCYDCDTMTWTQLQATGAPQPRNACTMTSIDNRLYVFGGRTGIDMGEGSLSDLHIFDTTLAEWAPVEASSPPPARSYHTMAAAGGKLYVFGGCGINGRLNDLHEFDPSTNSWRQLPSPDSVNPRGGSVLVASIDGSKLYVLGGFSGKELDDCHCFDLTSLTWSCPCCTSTTAKDLSHTAWTMPLARSVFGACALNHASSCSSSSNGHHAGHIVAFGGEVDPSAEGHSGAGQFTATLTCFDPVNNCSSTPAAAAAVNSSSSMWHGVTLSGEGPCPRGWFACTAMDGGLVLHGGLDCNNQRLEDMYLLKTCA
jgi:hypothetical protein